MGDKTAYHPDGQHVIMFREDRHTYTDNHGVKYISGTGFTGRFFPKFDAAAVSIKCSQGKNPKYAGRTPGEIRAEWSAEARRGSSEGDNAHAYAEARISGWPEAQVPAPISDRCKGLFNQVDRAVAGLLSRFVFIGAEVVIFSPGLKLSGMVDLLMWNPVTNTILILDWKTNKEFPSNINPFQHGTPPIEHLRDTAISHYSMQLSLYRMIIEKEKYFPNGFKFNQALIHLSPEKYTLIPLEYYEYEIEEALKHYGTH